MGGLYSMQSQVNELEFKAMRLRENDIPGKGFLGSKIKPEQISFFADFLNQVFGANLFEKAIKSVPRTRACKFSSAKLNGIPKK